MKKLRLLTTALLFSLCACGAPAAEEPDRAQTTPTEQTALTPVTSEEEVRALYAPDYETDPTNPPILSITEYEGDYLVRLGSEHDTQWLDWVYGQSGIRRRMLYVDAELLDLTIESPACIRAVVGGPNTYNGVPGFPRVERVALNLLYDELGQDKGYDLYSGGSNTASTETYWANAGESWTMGMVGRREAIRGAQIDAGGINVAFAPLADGSDFTAAYCEIPYTEVSLPENGNVLFVTFHDTFLDSGQLADGVTGEFLHNYGSLYPEDFPAGELSGSCVLIQKAEITQEGNNVVLALTLDTDRLSEDPLGDGDGYFQFTAGTGCTGVADNGPYFRLQLRITNPLFDD